MDVGELLSYQPKSLSGDVSGSRGGKSSKSASTNDMAASSKFGNGSAAGHRDVVDNTHGGGQRKRPSRFDAPPSMAASTESAQQHSGTKRSKGTTLEEDRLSGLKSATDAERERINRLASELPDAEPLNESNLRILVQRFEKAIARNRELRIKYADTPTKFLDSEAELDDILHEMHIIATAPSLYPILIELNVPSALLQLLSHENTDIAIAVVDLLQETTDADEVDEDVMDAVEEFVRALMEQQLFGRLVQNLERLDESNRDEAECVHDTFAIVENVLEFDGSDAEENSAASAAAQQGVLSWLLKRLRVKGFEANKLYVGEILSILVHDHDKNREQVGQFGIDILLQQLAAFKRHDPASPDETEYMELLFTSLCSCLMLRSNKDRFMHGEGLQLMNLMLREKKMSRISAIKVLDYAMSGPDGVANCLKFVDILGLRSIFPLLMKTPKPDKKSDVSRFEIEEHIVSIIASLVRNTCREKEGDNAENAVAECPQRERLFAKFVENDHEKVERLLELHEQYSERVREAEATMRDEEDEDEALLVRLRAGLLTLQQIDHILLAVVSYEPLPSIRQRLLELLGVRQGTSLDDIKNVVRDYAQSVGSPSEKQYLIGLLHSVDSKSS